MAEKDKETAAADIKPPAGKRRQQRLLFIPFLLLAAFVALAFLRISAQTDADNLDELPNALQGRPAPRLYLPRLEPAADTAPPSAGKAAVINAFFDSNSFKGQVTLVNFWGSWCPPCRAEHPFLMSLAGNSAFQLVGVNYKDSADNAKRFLGSFGNPFRQIGFDSNGRAAIDWGVYGPPETFVLDKNGLILYRFVGPMNEAAFRAKILPLIRRANAR